jgi:hypothetical protein
MAKGTQFTVTKRHLFNLFEHHPELVSASRYDVHSCAPLDIFQIFVNALETDT